MQIDTRTSFDLVIVIADREVFGRVEVPLHTLDIATARVRCVTMPLHHEEAVLYWQRGAKHIYSISVSTYS